jgi:hypothetical protein
MHDSTMNISATVSIGESVMLSVDSPSKKKRKNDERGLHLPIAHP